MNLLSKINKPIQILFFLLSIVLILVMPAVKYHGEGASFMEFLKHNPAEYLENFLFGVMGCVFLALIGFIISLCITSKKSRAVTLIVMNLLCVVAAVGTIFCLPEGFTTPATVAYLACVVAGLVLAICVKAAGKASAKAEEMKI